MEGQYEIDNFFLDKSAGAITCHSIEPIFNQLSMPAASLFIVISNKPESVKKTLYERKKNEIFSDRFLVNQSNFLRMIAKPERR